MIDQFTRTGNIGDTIRSYANLQEERNVGRQAPDGAITSLEELYEHLVANEEAVDALDFDLDTYIHRPEVGAKHREMQIEFAKASHDYPNKPEKMGKIWYVTIAMRPQWNSCNERWIKSDFALSYNANHFHDRELLADAPDNVPLWIKTCGETPRWSMDYVSLPCCGLNPLRHFNEHFIFADEDKARAYLAKATAEHKSDPIAEGISAAIDALCDDDAYDEPYYDEVDFDED